MMEQTGFGTNVTYTIVDRTLLEDRLNVERETGQITATFETRLGGTISLRRDEVEINGEIFNVGNTHANGLLGFSVVYFARLNRTTNERTLILARPESHRNNTITVNSRDVAEVTGTAPERLTFFYWVNRATDREPRRATIAANARLIFNGRHEALDDERLLHPSSGNVTLLDTRGTDEFDVVFVNQFRNVVVEDVSLQTGRVTDRYQNGDIVFDREDANVHYSIIRNGRQIGVEDLREWDVLSVSESRDGQIIRAFVSNATVEGMITQTFEDDGVRNYVINGVAYRRALNFDYPMELQTSGTFFLDIDGNIAAVDTRARAEQNYAFLIGMAEVGTFDLRPQFRIFTRDGETRILTGAARMRLNTTHSLTPEQILSNPLLMSGGNVREQLITFDVNARGEVIGIDTAFDNTDSRMPRTDRFTLNIHETLTFTSNNRRLSAGTTSIRVDANTIVFDIPENADGDTSLFAVRTMNMFSNDTEYDVLVYDLTEDFVARAIVVTSTTGVTAAGAPIAVVDRITTTHNPEMVITESLHAIQNGERIEILASDINVFRKANGDTLEQGDIIQFRTNVRGEVDAITVLFDVSGNEPNAIHMGTEGIIDIDSDLTIAFGRVVRRFAGSVNMEIDNIVHNFSTTNVHVYEFDSTRNTNRVRVVTPGDIRIFESPSHEWYLFVKIYRGTVEEMVVIR
jgi:hypothetical protein